MVSVGSLKLPDALLSAELKIMILEKVVLQLLEEQERSGRRMNIDMESLKRESLKQLREKYPDLNIRSEGDE